MKDTSESMQSFDPWRETPRKFIVILLLSVFLFFTTVGFSNDIMVLGREPSLRFALGVVLSGVFAIFYAIASISLLGKSWKAILPLLAVQIVVMGLLTRWLPNLPQQIPIGAAEVGQLRVRLIFDSIAILTVVSLGYAGFFYVSAKEARRYVKTRTEKAALESEMAAAREVQQVILPEDIESIPGFRIESIYLPAREVGGDFFQIIPHATDDSLLVVAGDVTGKGLRAGMLVALLIGAIRSIAEQDPDPDSLLKSLNRRLVGRADAQATCLALQIAKDGSVTLANAGHLAPYLNGVPIEIEGALPLGLMHDAKHSLTHFQLRENDKLVLVSDGILEATNPEGKLFGFDRLIDLIRSAANAAEVANTAQSFGQEDDISVISITRTAVQELAPVE